MSSFQKLPVDIQSFKTIRKDGYLYVDKTASIFRMVDEGVFYFLARPRRFGKSVLVSTLKSLFLAREPLFKGLWIEENSGWEWKEHPVVVIDFNTISHDTPENLQSGLGKNLERTAKNYHIHLEESLLKEKFTELILSLQDKTGMPVVILVDEYDKPIIDHLGKGENRLDAARRNRDILKNFLGVLKGSEVSSCLRLVFITGVSRFSRVSIFSDLNNLDDITMNDWYADMLGYTSEEMERYFKDHMARFAAHLGVSAPALREKLARRYDGYRFSDRDVRVYNPFSILKVFKYMKFKDYWFETGTPTFLVDLLKERAFNLPEIENIEIDEQIFSAYDLDHL
ncbi:MAG: AAA family ATPase, partial [Desulfobacterales bacterium]|nr:AAA family ATPase [Desulfobacterales bacterium]